MTYKEKFDNETDWKKKVLIVELFHIQMVLKHGKKNWPLVKTAQSFGVSIALISENLTLAIAIRHEHPAANCDSRNKALKLIRELKNDSYKS